MKDTTKWWRGHDQQVEEGDREAELRREKKVKVGKKMRVFIPRKTRLSLSQRSFNQWHHTIWVSNDS